MSKLKMIPEPYIEERKAFKDVMVCIWYSTSSGVHRESYKKFDYVIIGSNKNIDLLFSDDIGGRMLNRMSIQGDFVRYSEPDEYTIRVSDPEIIEIFQNRRDVKKRL